MVRAPLGTDDRDLRLDELVKTHLPIRRSRSRQARPGRPRGSVSPGDAPSVVLLRGQELPEIDRVGELVARVGGEGGLEGGAALRCEQPRLDLRTRWCAAEARDVLERVGEVV